jgi:hypothetical protein
MAAYRAAQLKDQLESETSASIKPIDAASAIANRNLVLSRGLLAAEQARAESRGTVDRVKRKEIEYQSALQKYQHRLSADAVLKIGVHPRLVIDIQVEIDGALQPNLQRLDTSLHNLIPSTRIVPNDNVNEKLKTQFEALDNAMLDGKDTTAILHTIDQLRRPVAGDQAVLYAPLHDAVALEEFQTPTRITAKTRALKKKRDKLRTEERFAEADDVQRELDAMTFTKPDPKKVTKNIETLLTLLFSDKVTIGPESYFVGAHEWMKSKYYPFGFQMRRREIGIRVVQPPIMHLHTFETLLQNYAKAIGEHTDVPDVQKEEREIEDLFVDNETTIKMVGGGSAVYSDAVLTALESIMKAPSTIAKATGLTAAVRSAASSSAVVGAIYETTRSDPINPYATFKFVLSNPTQYGTFRNIAWNTHVGRYVRIPTQKGKCRAFIYEYLAYRVSIYNDFFQTTRYSGYADLPFMVGSRKNSELIHLLLTSSFDQALLAPLTELLKKWKEYDTKVYHRAARLMHFDALILRFLCREVLLRTLTQTACAINILAVKLVMRQASSCRSRDQSFECVRKVNQMAAKLITNPLLDLLPPSFVKSPPVPSLRNPKVDTSPLLEALQGMNYKVNGVKVEEDMEYDCPEILDRSKFKDDTGRYIALLEETVETMKADPTTRLYLSFSHAAPCVDVTHAVLTSKLALYQERMQEIVAETRRPRAEINKLHKILEGNVLGNLLASKKTFESEYDYEPDFTQLVEFKCKDHKPPQFDPWYGELNQLHDAYAKDLRSLYEPVAQLAQVVQNLYSSDSLQTPFQAFNQLDYAISAYTLIADSCAEDYDAGDLDVATKPKDTSKTKQHLRLLLELMEGLPRFVPPPDVQLATKRLSDNTMTLFEMIKSDNVEKPLTHLNLHAPLQLNAKLVWKEYLKKLNKANELEKAAKDAPEPLRKEKMVHVAQMKEEATAFLDKTGNLKSNAFAAHSLYDQIEGFIRAHNYHNAVRSLRLILSFNVYRYNWNQFFKLPTFQQQKAQLEFLLDDMTVSFEKELNKELGEEVYDLSTPEKAIRIAKAYKAVIDARLKQVYSYLSTLLLSLGNVKEAAEYKRRMNSEYFTSYYAALDASRAGQSVFDLRTTFRSTKEWTMDVITEKVRKCVPVTREGKQARFAFLMQFTKDVSWLDPSIDYSTVIDLLSPDHPLNQIVQHVSSSLFPDQTSLSEARSFVSGIMYTYRKDPDESKQEEFIDRALTSQPKTEKRIQKQLKLFAPSPKRTKAMDFLQRSVRARENLWPGESKTIFSKFTENMPYLDGEYTLNIVVRVQLLSKNNPLIQLKEKQNKTCDDKREEVAQLRKFLFKKAVALPPASK